MAKTENLTFEEIEELMGASHPEKKAEEMPSTPNSAMNEAFYAWIAMVVETEEKRDKGELRDKATGERIPKRYVGDEFRTPSPKMTVCLEQCLPFLEPKLQDWLRMVLDGEILFGDQIYGKGPYEGRGIMDLRFSLSRDMFVPDAEINKKREKANIMRALAQSAFSK